MQHNIICLISGMDFWLAVNQNKTVYLDEDDEGHPATIAWIARESIRAINPEANVFAGWVDINPLIEEIYDATNEETLIPDQDFYGDGEAIDWLLENRYDRILQLAKQNPYNL